MITIALLSDIHGNLPALEAVLADLSSRAADMAFVLGDLVNGCPWSAEVLDRLSDLGWPMLLGNHDDAVLQLGTPRMEPRYGDRRRYAALWWTREHLSPRHLDLLARLPLETSPALADAPAIRLVHGLPGNFFVGCRPDSPPDWVARHLARVAEGTIAGGHTHVPMVRRIARWLVVNTGAVGISYDGDPRASYAVLRGDAAGWQVEIRRVDYDRSVVDAGYRESGLLVEGGVMAEMFRRSVLSGLPWVSDFAWWIREQPPAVSLDMSAALRAYDSQHGPGRWAFPYA
ncbi:MAG: metallophosphoesterase family protein [Anaerolineae bacterium]